MVDNHESPRYGRGRLHNSRSDLRLVTEERLLLVPTTATASGATGTADNNGLAADHQQNKRRAGITVSCISRVGSQQGVAIESRSEWVVSYGHHQHGHRHQQQTAAAGGGVVSTTVTTVSETPVAENERSTRPAAKSNSSRTGGGAAAAGDDDAQHQGPIALSSGKCLSFFFLLLTL